MASQVTHIVFSEQLFPFYFQKYNEREFLAGSVFPDIRYLGVLSRNQTHLYGLSINDVLLEKNSFMAGLKFHGYLDECWEQYYKLAGIQDLVPDEKLGHLSSAVKGLQDELLYSSISWHRIIEIFEQPYQEELDFGISLFAVSQWHTILMEYFKQAPTMKTLLRFSQYLDLDSEVIVSNANCFHKIKQNQEVKKAIQGFSLWFIQFIESQLLEEEVVV